MHNMANNSPKYEDATTLEEFGRKNDPVNSFMVSLISFLALFILPFSSYFWPLAIIVPVASIAGVVMGHLTRRRLKREHAEGQGLALAGLILAYAAMALSSLWFLLFVTRIFVAIAIGG